MRIHDTSLSGSQRDTGATARIKKLRAMLAQSRVYLARLQEFKRMFSGIPSRRVSLDVLIASKSRRGPSRFAYFDANGDYRAINPAHPKSYPEPCGAIACLAGWALLYPPFQKAGILDRTVLLGACDHLAHPTLRCAAVFFGASTSYFLSKNSPSISHKKEGTERINDMLADRQATTDYLAAELKIELDVMRQLNRLQKKKRTTP